MYNGIAEGRAQVSTSAKSVANYIIAAFQARHDEITNLKLQKLVYYAQAWHLALYEKPLFQEKIEAWVHGPVIPVVFHRFKQYGWKSISEAVISSAVPEHFHAHLNEVLRVYGKFNGVVLERMTHQESPWRDARAGLAPDEPSNRIITHESMKKYYSTRLHA